MATSAADPQGQEGHSLTRAGEDYLESIYRLSLESAEGDKSVRSVDVAEQLEVSKASVNKALSQLKEMGMVVQSRYGRWSSPRRARPMPRWSGAPTGRCAPSWSMTSA